MALHETGQVIVIKSVSFILHVKKHSAEAKHCHNIITDEKHTHMKLVSKMQTIITQWTEVHFPLQLTFNPHNVHS